MKIQRKRKFIAFIVILFLLVAGGIGLLLYRSQYLIFQDPIIEASAKNNLYKSGRIHKSEAAKLKYFQIKDYTMQYIETLEDLEKFPNLELLCTLPSPEYDEAEAWAEFEKDYQISADDYEKYIIQMQEVIPQLSQLKKIHFCPYTIIFDMAPFAGADQIEELVIRDNRVQDLTGIGEMKSLRILDLEHNKFTDISPLKELIYLEALDIRDNQVENLDILLELPNLKVVFYEAQNKEQEEVLKKLIDKGCTVVETKDSFYSFLDKMGIETVELYSTDNI